MLGHHHPYYHYWGRAYHSRPSRFVWFALGGLAASWYFKAKESCHASRYYDHCYRPPIQPHHVLEDRGSIARTINNIPAPDSNRSTEAPSNNRWSFGYKSGSSSSPESWSFKSQKQWDEDKARFAAMTQQATDAMTDLSEATLDNILSTVEHLKVKLAQQKAIREMQRKELDERLEHEKKEQNESTRRV
jgi:hypothetical protein